METVVREKMYESIALYNERRYFEAQEGLEGVHAQSKGSDQALARALLSLACAMHLHFHRGGGRGVHNLLRQTLLHLHDLRPAHRGVAVDELFEACEAYLNDLQERRKPGAGFLDRWLAPRVRFEPE